MRLFRLYALAHLKREFFLQKANDFVEFFVHFGITKGSIISLENNAESEVGGIIVVYKVNVSWVIRSGILYSS